MKGYATGEDVFIWNRAGGRMPASQGNTTDRRVEQLDDVANRELSPRAREGRLKLQDAAGVAGHNHVRLQRGDVARFPLTKLRRGFRLHQVIDPRGATADRGLGDFQ